MRALPEACYLIIAAKVMSEVAAFIKQESVEIVDLAGSSSSDSDSDDEERHCRESRSICSSPSSYEDETNSGSSSSEGEDGEFLKETMSPPKGLPTTMTWSGLRFTAQDRIPSKYLVGVWKGRYRCSIYRSAKGNNCKAALKVTFDPDKEQQISVDATKAEHTCCQVEVDENERRLPCSEVHDAKEEMKLMCERIALSDFTKTSIDIANEVVAAMGTKYDELSELQSAVCIFYASLL